MVALLRISCPSEDLGSPCHWVSYNPMVCPNVDYSRTTFSNLLKKLSWEFDSKIIYFLFKLFLLLCRAWLQNNNPWKSGLYQQDTNNNQAH